MATEGTPTREEQSILECNRELRDRHAGQRCFILATGPSIKQQNLKLLQGESCIAVSNFFVHPDYSRIKPLGHCIAPWHPPITRENWVAWLRELEAGLCGATLFMGLEDRAANERNALFRERDVRYLRFHPHSACGSESDVDLAGALPRPQSVSVMALAIAVYMGFREIYLLGCDHSWIAHFGSSSHFYQETEHALVRGGYNECSSELGDVEAQCAQMMALWSQYRFLKRVADKKGCSIGNATEGGLLDVFPRVRYESLFPG